MALGCSASELRANTHDIGHTRRPEFTNLVVGGVVFAILAFLLDRLYLFISGTEVRFPKDEKIFA